MSNKHGHKHTDKRHGPHCGGRVALRLARCLLPAALLLAAGCTWDNWHLLPEPPPPPPAPDAFVVGTRGLQPVPPAGTGLAAESQQRLAAAHELMRQSDYKTAEKLFHALAENNKNTVQVAEEARFYEAECLRLQGRLPKACDTYHKTLVDFPFGIYKEQALQRMFDIANFWLDDTRQEMQETKEEKDGKRWVVWPHFIHFEKSKPLADEEGRAIEALQQVRYTDMRGPLADKALFLTAAIHFYNEDYKEADQDFTQLIDQHQNSAFMQQAVELDIIAKTLSTGGSDYDGRKVAEARQLVQTALDKYPALRAKEGDFLTRQLVGITYQQADKDYNIAEFYRRTGHPASAYFCYEIVRRRYPNTKFFDMATDRMQELKAKLEKEASKSLPPITPAPLGEGMADPGQRPLENLPQPRPLENLPQPRPLPSAGQPQDTLPPPRPFPQSGSEPAPLPPPRPMQQPIPPAAPTTPPLGVPSNLPANTVPQPETAPVPLPPPRPVPPAPAITPPLGAVPGTPAAAQPIMEPMPLAVQRPTIPGYQPLPPGAPLLPGAGTPAPVPEAVPVLEPLPIAVQRPVAPPG